MTGLIVNALVNQLVKVGEIGSGCVSKKSFYLIGYAFKIQWDYYMIIEIQSL